MKRIRKLRAGRVLMPAALVLVLLVALASSSGLASATESARTPQASPKPKKPVLKPSLRGVGLIRWATQYPKSTGYERYQYVIVSRSNARAAGRLPGKSLVYMSGTSVQVSWSTGVSYQEALANDWLLKDSSGAYLRNVQYGAYIGDFGNAAYQQRFASNVVSFLAATKAKGIFLDDVVGYPGGPLTNGALSAKYPTPEAWEDAMVSFVAVVGSSLRAQGYYVLANAAKFVGGDSRSDSAEHTAEFWRRLAPSLNGLMTEHWLQSPTDEAQLRAVGSRWFENWIGWEGLVNVAQTAGKDFFGVMYGSAGDVRAMRFGRGSFLLDWDGAGGAFIYFVRDNDDPYHPAWVTQFGKPLQRKVGRAPGVWQREYARGTVVVNATSAPVTIRVHGALQTIGATDALFSPKQER